MARAFKRGEYRRDRIIASAVFITPSLILLLLISIIPLCYAVYISFLKYNLMRPASSIKFCGFDNYIKVLTNKDFIRAAGWTFTFATIAVVVEIALSLGLALMLNSEATERYSGPFKTGLIVPMMVGAAICGTIWKLMLYPMYGVVTCVGKQLGLGTIDWLGTTKYARIAVTLVNIWGATPMCMLIFQAALKTVPGDLIEAARIDGASPFQIFYRITMPVIRNFTALVVTMRVSDALRSFEGIVTLTNGGPARSTETIGAVIYRTAFDKSNIGQGAAASFILFIMVALISMLIMNLIRKKDDIYTISKSDERGVLL